MFPFPIEKVGATPKGGWMCVEGWAHCIHTNPSFGMTMTQDNECFPEEDPEAKCPSAPKGINAAKVQGAVRPRRVGGVTTYQCKKKYPYAVGGQSKLTCQEDGSYDGEPLECSGGMCYFFFIIFYFLFFIFYFFIFYFFIFIFIIFF